MGWIVTRLMGEQGPLVALVTPTLEDMGFELVRILVMGKQRKILQVMADRADGTPITVEDCEALSRALSAVLDVDDPIHGAYDLEVSSPGVDRPLTRRSDFERFAGLEARLEAEVAIDGRRRVKGRLRGITDDDEVIVAVAEPGPDESEEWRVPLGALTRAKLVMTDELIRHVMKADKAARKGRDSQD
jgi:ribosome maturation factor RimP